MFFKAGEEENSGAKEVIPDKQSLNGQHRVHEFDEPGNMLQM